MTSVAITSLIETAVGQPLSMRQVRETIAHLVNLNLFDDVQVRSEAVGARRHPAALRLVPAHPVDRIEFRGQLGLDGRGPAAGGRRIASATSRGRRRSTSVAGLLRTLYRDRGYPSASVSGEVVETHDPDRATLVIDRPVGPPAADRGRAADAARRRGARAARPSVRRSDRRALRQGRDGSRAPAVDRPHARARLLRGARQSRRAVPAGRRGAERVGDARPAHHGGVLPATTSRERTASAWCRSGPRRRPTRTCSRIRRGPSRCSCAAAAIARRGSRSRARPGRATS